MIFLFNYYLIVSFFFLQKINKKIIVQNLKINYFFNPKFIIFIVFIVIWKKLLFKCF